MHTWKWSISNRLQKVIFIFIFICLHWMSKKSPRRGYYELKSCIAGPPLPTAKTDVFRHFLNWGFCMDLGWQKCEVLLKNKYLKLTFPGLQCSETFPCGGFQSSPQLIIPRNEWRQQLTVVAFQGLPRASIWAACWVSSVIPTHCFLLDPFPEVCFS